MIATLLSHDIFAMLQYGFVLRRLHQKENALRNFFYCELRTLSLYQCYHLHTPLLNRIVIDLGNHHLLENIFTFNQHGHFFDIMSQNYNITLFVWLNCTSPIKHQSSYFGVQRILRIRQISFFYFAEIFATTF